MRLLSRLFPVLFLSLIFHVPARAEVGANGPHVVLLTVDTLRADRLSLNGYERPTSPALDALLRGGASFRDARTVEPLTAPALASLLSGVSPDRHGCTRNGLRMRPGLHSLPKTLGSLGWQTAAFISNWTLKDELSGLGEHFHIYEEVFTRKRIAGLFRAEAPAVDVLARLTAWLECRDDPRPLFLWVHFIEPHAPYEYHSAYQERLGLPDKGRATRRDRYDSEVAAVDDAVQALLELLRREMSQDFLLAFAADHGESLGEHGYWGHGRHLYDVCLRVPMGLVWPGRIPAMAVNAQALITDLAPTILELLSVPAADALGGFSWAGVLAGDAAPQGRVTGHQAHRGSVEIRSSSERARRLGLLEVGLVSAGRKEILKVQSEDRLVFDLVRDPLEEQSLEPRKAPPSMLMRAWLEAIRRGIQSAELPAPPELDEDSVEALRALGYLE